MYYKTRTYIAGDWTGDSDLIEQLTNWNKSNYWSLSFSDAHKLMQARDSSLPCSIKRSLTDRLNASKAFVLIVGRQTDLLTKGGCRYCKNYSSKYCKCNHGMRVDHRSFIQYECEKAVKDNLKIVVLYNYANVDHSKCPEVLRYKGTHINAYYRATDGNYYWNYSAIKSAIG